MSTIGTRYFYKNMNGDKYYKSQPERCVECNLEVYPINRDTLQRPSVNIYGIFCDSSCLQANMKRRQYPVVSYKRAS